MQTVKFVWTQNDPTYVTGTADDQRPSCVLIFDARNIFYRTHFLNQKEWEQWKADIKNAHDAWFTVIGENPTELFKNEGYDKVFFYHLSFTNNSNDEYEHFILTNGGRAYIMNEAGKTVDQIYS